MSKGIKLNDDLICYLADIMQEKGLSISEVNKATGISRTTLTALTKGRAQGIQFHTISNLCIYLDITVEQLFEVVKYD